jgi:hypothetical protein
MFHLCDAGQPKECLVLDFPQTNLTRAELSTLRTTLSEKYQGKLNFLEQPNHVYVPYFTIPNTILTTQLKTPTPTPAAPLTPSLVSSIAPTVSVPDALPEALSPIAQFNQKYCAPCPTKCTTNETYLRCITTLSFQELQTHTTLLTKLAERSAYKKKEPSAERHLLDGISWMSCEGQKGPYEKALEKENVPNTVYAAWKQRLNDAVSAGKKGAVIGGTKDDKPVDYWCWLNTYEGEISICRRPTQTK